MANISVLLLQEHKLIASQTRWCENVLPRLSHTYWEHSIAEHGHSSGVYTSIMLRYFLVCLGTVPWCQVGPYGWAWTWRVLVIVVVIRRRWRLRRRWW